MVFFTCNACGESLKKNAVEKHYRFKCRQCDSLTCVDCHKDFYGDEYQTHVKCFTEDEKYGGKNYVAKASANKGERKQQQWIENLNALVTSSSDLGPDVRAMLQVIMRHENIPRKRPKFTNFVRNIQKGVRQDTIDKTWQFFEQAIKNKEEEVASATTVERQVAKENAEIGSENVSPEVQELVKQFRGRDKDVPKKMKKFLKQARQLAPSAGEETLEKAFQLLANNASNNIKEKAQDQQPSGKDCRLDADVQAVLDSVSSMESIPQKKSKFIKLVKTSLKDASPASIERAWEHLQRRQVQEAENCSEVQRQSKDAADDSRAGVPRFTGLIEKAGKKRKRSSDAAEGGDEEASVNKKSKLFSWEGAVLDVVKKKGQIKLSKLRKKVVGEYLNEQASLGKTCAKSEHELWAKALKRIEKSKQLQLKKDVVLLLE